MKPFKYNKPLLRNISSNINNKCACANGSRNSSDDISPYYNKNACYAGPANSNNSTICQEGISADGSWGGCSPGTIDGTASGQPHPCAAGGSNTGSPVCSFGSGVNGTTCHGGYSNQG